ncbi:MAG: hypothetical protein Q4A04_08395, partial [Eubacteriales bacterium]|nr:hypothetical protein [Eubacteriales bacterium]
MASKDLIDRLNAAAQKDQSQTQAKQEIAAANKTQQTTEKLNQAAAKDQSQTQAKQAIAQTTANGGVAGDKTLNFPTAGAVDNRDRDGSGSGSGFGSGSGSSGSSQIQPKNDDSKYQQEIEDLKGTIDALKELYATGQSDWQKQLAEMANQYTTAQNDWAKQLADLYKSQDEKEAQWKLDIENMYQKGKDDAYTVAEEERKKA